MRLLLLAPALLLASPAFAQDTAAPPTPAAPEQLDTGRDTVTVGVGGVYMPDYEGADHSGFSAVPAVIATAAARRATSWIG